MKRFFFHIGYDGFNYHGWQRQPEHLSIQQVLEENLSKILKEPVTILGCGRTDAKVHAAQYFFHLDTEKKWDFDLVFRLNKMLPADIAVFDIIEVGAGNKGLGENSECETPNSKLPHAQYDAKQRTYDYFIHTYKDPFLNNVSSFYREQNLNLSKMKEAASLLTQYNDYRAFCKSPDHYKHTLCKISSAKLFSDKHGDKLRFQISSDRFLHGMLRAIVAKLLKVGKGKMKVEEFESLLGSQTPNSKLQTPANIEFAYPQGLYLSKVVYPFLDIPTRTQISAITEKENEWEIV